jgi:hypothetical protein
MRHHVPLEMMKTKRKIVLIAAILTVILSVAAIFATGLLRSPEKALLKIMSDRVDLQVKNVHYTEVGDSGMTWEIVADTARYRKKENLAFFDQVTVRLVMKDGRVFVMKGDRGRFNTALCTGMQKSGLKRTGPWSWKTEVSGSAVSE